MWLSLLISRKDKGGGSMEEKKLGEIVQRARREHGLTQQALCQKTGLSYSTLAKIERGAIKSPSVFTIQHIATALNISLDELLAEVLPHGVPKKAVSQNGVKFVYFDMNGCLVRAATNAFARLAEESGASQDTVETVFWSYNDDVCRGIKTIDELNTAMAERLGIMVDWVRLYLDALEAMPGMRELVEWVAARYRVGILTNTMPGIVDQLFTDGFLPQVAYDAVVDSSEVHALKPESRIYDIATAMADVAPQEILLIDDDRPNLTAAAKQGWHIMKFQALQPEDSIEAIRSALQLKK